MYFNPLRVFLPVSGACAVLGTLVLVGGLVLRNQIYDGTILVLYSLALQVAVIGLLADLIDKRS